MKVRMEQGNVVKKAPPLKDEDYMHQALMLARKGAGWVNPNPQVGAVVVKDGNVIGFGYHTKFGELHAEREALARCKEDPAGSTVYVTLEPCCHTGKTPPCTDALIEANVARVVIGAPDPNPLVAGKGAQLLRDAGIEVTEGVMLDECTSINRHFFHYINTKMPYVIMKYAMTADGKVTTKQGASQWLTGAEAVKRTHEDRQTYAAIMVGSGTVLADDPMLTARLENREIKNPLRVIADSRARTPLNSKIVKSAREIPTLIAVGVNAATDRVEMLEGYGCEVLRLPEKGGHIDLTMLMQELGKRGIDSVIAEGGATLNWALVEAGLVNRVQCYFTPKIFGGSAAPSPVRGAGFKDPADALELGEFTVTKLGHDLLIESEVL